jgi:GNAT superfamily N-acetyltransferase
MFAHHHYLTSEIPPIVDCYLATWNGVIVGFASSICLPGKSPPLYEGDTRIKYRECRTVVLPDFQGLGIGTRLSDAVGDINIEKGYRYFSKTAHIRMGTYRQKSDKWRATQTNLVDRSKSTKPVIKTNGLPDTQGLYRIPLDKKRICYSHEYIGADRKSYDPKWLEVRKSLQTTFDF